MRIVVGLGNPGSRYDKTRHNAGFWVIDALADRFGVTVLQQKWQALVGECRIGSEKIIFCKPQTYMNLSGEAVAEISSFYSEIRVASDLIVIYDDMDFPLGQMKLRESGSAGGHNGLKSLIQHLGTSQFPRIRFGIGRPEPGQTVIDYVLSPPPKDAGAVVHEMVTRAADAVEYACQQSFEAAMNRFNTATSG